MHHALSYPTLSSLAGSLGCPNPQPRPCRFPQPTLCPTVVGYRVSGGDRGESCCDATKVVINRSSNHINAHCNTHCKAQFNTHCPLQCNTHGYVFPVY